MKTPFGGLLGGLPANAVAAPATIASSRAAMRSTSGAARRAREVDACRKGCSLRMMTSGFPAILGPCPFQADNVMARRINFYATGEFDRAALRREDLAWIRARLADPTSRLYPIWRTRNFVSDPEAPRAMAFDAAMHGALVEAASTVVLLGF